MVLLGLVSVTGMPYVVLMPILPTRYCTMAGSAIRGADRSHDLGAVRLGILMGAAGWVRCWRC